MTADPRQVPADVPLVRIECVHDGHHEQASPSHIATVWRADGTSKGAPRWREALDDPNASGAYRTTAEVLIYKAKTSDGAGDIDRAARLIDGRNGHGIGAHGSWTLQCPVCEARRHVRPERMDEICDGAFAAGWALLPLHKF